MGPGPFHNSSFIVALLWLAKTTPVGRKSGMSSYQSSAIDVAKLASLQKMTPSCNSSATVKFPLKVNRCSTAWSWMHHPTFSPDIRTAATLGTPRDVNLLDASNCRSAALESRGNSTPLVSQVGCSATSAWASLSQSSLKLSIEMEVPGASDGRFLPM